MSSISDAVPEESTSELKVTFYPPLFLQRRIWILDVLRGEKVTQVLDIGCGEGQLLSVLCEPALWLPPPPHHILLPSNSTPPSPVYNDEIPNLHPTHLYGLDISDIDLEFAVKGTAVRQGGDSSGNWWSHCLLRWENLEVRIWKGGLELINEEFIDVECIVSTEVIEHLPPDIFRAFAPVTLGVYHPRLLLITTPSYTFNARFTAPNAPSSVRKGYRDPTGRTDRIFRHEDHKFEWTCEEFRTWCEDVAPQWGYSVQVSSIGHAVEIDEWGRDEELGGATSVAVFRRFEMAGRELKAREVLEAMQLQAEPHKLLATQVHSAHTEAEKPRSLDEISLAIKKKMEDLREAFMRVEEIWFEQEIAILCGGWIEILIRAVEESESLSLKKDRDGIRNDRGVWLIELIGGVANPRQFWTNEGEPGLDHLSPDWIPEEDSEGGWDESTDMEGDISWGGSEDDEDPDAACKSPESGWGQVDNVKRFGHPWAIKEALETAAPESVERQRHRVHPSSASSVTGWDGDASEDTT